MKLYSYVVEHDYGIAPNPENNVCTLVHCKFRREHHVRDNLVEKIQEGDWIIGTGAKSCESAGIGKIIYLMRVDQKIAFTDYLSNTEYQNRADCQDRGNGNRFALISNTFYYFGKNAINIPSLPLHLTNIGIEKSKQGYQYKRFDENYIKQLISYFSNKYEYYGIYGTPCVNDNPNVAMLNTDSQANTTTPICKILKKGACAKTKINYIRKTIKETGCFYSVYSPNSKTSCSASTISSSSVSK